MRIHLLADQPIETAAEDALGLSPFVESLQRELEGAETPLVYGLLGDWGAGRTSALRLLEARLRQAREASTSTLVPIAFNARQYQNDVNLLYPLLYAVRQAYQSDRRITALAGPRGFGGMFARLAATSALAASDVALRRATGNLANDGLPLKELREQLDAVRQQPDQLEGILRGWADTVTQMRSGFEALLGTYAGDLARADPRLKVEEVRFAILIDDLDRCAPETLLATLEATRYFLAARRALMVLALNCRIAVRAASRQLGVSAADGHAYLQSLLHTTLAVPAPAPERVGAFARARLATMVTDLDPALRPVVEHACDEAAQTLEAGCLLNPRQLKHVLNGFARFLDRHMALLEQFSLPNVVRLLALAEIEPGLFQAISAQPEQVLAALATLGTPEFSLPAFEQAHDVFIRAPYAQLLAMRKLFQFEVDPDKPGLHQQIEAVEALTSWG